MFIKKLDFPNLIAGAILGFFVGNLIPGLFNMVYNKFHHERPYDIIVNDNTADVRNMEGDRIFVIRSESNISASQIININNKNKFIAIGTGRYGNTPGTVSCISTSLDTIWEFNTFDAKYVKSVGRSVSDHFHVTHLIEGNFFDNIKSVAVLASDPTWFTSRLVILKVEDGEVLYDYWHTGLLSGMEIRNIGGSEYSEILLSGYNNNLRSILKTQKNPGVVLTISPELYRIGQSYPGGYSGLPIVPVHWYTIVEPVSEGNSAVATYEDYNMDGKADIKMITTDGRLYYMDYDGYLLGIGNSDGRRYRGANDLYNLTMLWLKDGEWVFEGAKYRL